jgi:hypothetical protein
MSTLLSDGECGALAEISPRSELILWSYELGPALKAPYQIHGRCTRLSWDNLKHLEETRISRANRGLMNDELTQVEPGLGHEQAPAAPMNHLRFCFVSSNCI